LPKRIDPAGAFAVHSVLPVWPRTIDSSVEAAREDHVVRDGCAAEVRRGQLPLPEHVAGGGVDGSDPAARVLKSEAKPQASPVALACAGKSSQGPKRRFSARAIGVSTPPKSPGMMSVGRRGSGPVSFWCLPTDSVHRLLPSSARKAYALPILPATSTTSVWTPSIASFVTIAGIIRS
jgi:hypothetical protein